MMMGSGLLAMSGVWAAAPVASAPKFANGELIVLLASGRNEPAPEDVVNRAEHGLSLPDGIGIGGVVGARLVIPEPDRRPILAGDPEAPSARLQRYVVLSYPLVVDLEAVRRALLLNPHVLAVEYNLQMHVSVLPNDPLFSSTDGSGNPRTPSQYQWGSYALHLPQAWDYNKGHAYVGVIDLGLDTAHPDLQSFHQASGTTVYDGGNFRPQFAFDYGYPGESPNSVDEGQAELEGGQSRPVDVAGHGTHVAGIVAATPNNSIGVAGGCWNCSLIISKVSTLGQINNTGPWYNAFIAQGNAVAGINGAIQKGAQVLNLSFGYRAGDTPPPPNCQGSTNTFCTALQLAEDRDVLVVVASGNDHSPTVDFPASDSRTLAVGGIDAAGNFWNDCTTGSFECGSNYNSGQIVAPAKQILSTFYRGIYYAGTGSVCPGFTDYGLCTGTSMASPFMAASVGVLRSVNPLLSKDNIKDLLLTHLENPTGWNSQFGYGKPDVSAAVRAALGTTGGAQIPNRLTPLFSLYSNSAQDFFYTSVPQMASAAILDSPSLYSSTGPLLPGYPSFPGISCPVGPCNPSNPKASVDLFTGDKAPYAGSPPLVPLYRMTYKPSSLSDPDRDTTYTTDNAGILAFKGAGYELDGIEGYIYQRCTPEVSCIPPGAVRLYRLYNSSRDDYAIFPESELASMQTAGYASVSGLNDWIGYVYPHTDADGDHLIDGFETLIGTNPLRVDSDCDGLSDGVEVLGYPTRDPLVPAAGAGCVPPVARFSFTCTGLSCSFNGATSSDNIGIVSYAWTFGDSASGSGVTASHTYAATGGYSVTLTVTDTDGLTASVSTKVSVNSDPLPAAESFFAVPRCRVLDTRGSAPLTSGAPLVISVAGNCNIPSSAKALSLAVTAIQPTDSGFLGLYPGNLPVTTPNKGILNFLPATSPRSNNAIVRLATDGSGTLGIKLTVSGTPGQVHLTIDVDGYFSQDTSAPSGAQGPFGFQPLAPCRVVDTRPSSPLVSGVARTFSVQGNCGIPASGVGAVSSNLKIVPTPSDGGAIVLYPAGVPVPVATNLSFNAGINWIAEGERSALASSTPDLGMQFVSSTSSGSVHAVFDVNGYFSSGAPLKYHPLAGCRAVDTRAADTGGPSLTGGSTRTFQLQGNCNVPVGAKAVFLNVVALGATATGDIRLYASNAAAPAVGTLSFDIGESALGNGAIVPLGTTIPDLALQVSPFTGGLNLILDVFGYFE